MAKVTLTTKSQAMKSFLPIIVVCILFAGCSSVYKSGQTPDDVYFSPTPPRAEYVQMESRHHQDYSDYEIMPANPRRYRGLHDNYYSYNPNYYESYGPYLRYTNPYYYNNNNWGNYSYWNSNGYDPYNGHVVLVQPQTKTSNKPRMFNMNVYNPPNPEHKSGRFLGVAIPGSSHQGDNNQPRNYNRNVYNPENSNAGFHPNTFNPSPSRSTSPPASSTPSSGSGSRGSSSAPVRHF
ncbi:MAG: hypothetical protein NVS9B7_22350 [Flavisolibacter sp.]